MDACVTKPIDVQQLLSLLERFLNKASPVSLPVVGEPAAVTVLATSGDKEGSLDEARLREIEALGGTGFLREMLSTLMSEVEILTINLQRAQGQNDLYLFRDVRDRLYRHSSKRPTWFRKAKAIDGLKKGQSPLGSEDAVKFLECSLLFVDVYQNGPESNGINGRIIDTP